MAKVPERGYPLFTPGPNPDFPDHYQRGGLYVGDVGFISAAGGFVFLFNLCLPRDHPFNQINGVPDGFNDIHLMVLEEQGYKDVTVDMEADRRGTLSLFAAFQHSLIDRFKRTSRDATEFELTAQAGVAVPGGEVGAGSGVPFSISHSEGGILVLPHGSWSFDILNGLGSLSGASQKLAVLVAHLAGADVSASYSWQSAGSVISKVGPTRGYEEGKPFLCGVLVSLREVPPPLLSPLLGTTPRLLHSVPPLVAQS
ncbi:hypothetical protein JVT61DRAFT_5212 [Boletus reticuloceps]|uniref:Uncharacterized protein n=1 Tax=Boletus reticuloceps TaxID=495285 RepID=A0A8I3AFU0_9AGAM|nr:hypothetical protein JVT61DRAFT_5212 [Boletus reticuloceps]